LQSNFSMWTNIKIGCKLKTRNPTLNSFQRISSNLWLAYRSSYDIIMSGYKIGGNLQKMSKKSTDLRCIIPLHVYNHVWTTHTLAVYTMMGEPPWVCDINISSNYRGFKPNHFSNYLSLRRVSIIYFYLKSIGYVSTTRAAKVKLLVLRVSHLYQHVIYMLFCVLAIPVYLHCFHTSV